MLLLRFHRQLHRFDEMDFMLVEHSLYLSRALSWVWKACRVDRGGGGPAVQRVAFGRINIVSSCVCGQSKKNGRRKFSPRGKCKCCGSNVNEERVLPSLHGSLFETSTVCGCPACTSMSMGRRRRLHAAAVIVISTRRSMGSISTYGSTSRPIACTDALFSTM